MMGRICYTGMIELFNQEHEQAGSDLTRHDLIPEDVEML